MAKSYYVSIIRNAGTPHRRVGLLAGPFSNHEDALALVDTARALAVDLDDRAWWDAFGTVGIEDYAKPGVLNARLGL